MEPNDKHDNWYDKWFIIPNPKYNVLSGGFVWLSLCNDCGNIITLIKNKSVDDRTFSLQHTIEIINKKMILSLSYTQVWSFKMGLAIVPLIAYALSLYLTAMSPLSTSQLIVMQKTDSLKTLHYQTYSVIMR